MATNRVTFTKSYAVGTGEKGVGEEVGGVPIRVSKDGLSSEMARVRITGVVSRALTERPDWMPADSAGGKQYPITEVTYEGEVLWSRASGVPAASNALAQHFAKLAADD